MFKRFKRTLLKGLLPIPVQARHVEYSIIVSADDDCSQPSPRLITTSTEAIRQAQSVSLADVRARLTSPPYVVDIWPGESYKLLAGFVLTVKPKLIVEIGTGGGTSALTMKKVMPADAKLVTFDVTPWKDYEGHLFVESDLADGRLAQYTEDLTQPEVFARHRGLLERADLLFIDAAKDGVMEQTLIDALKAVSFHKPPLVIFDDIRVWNMLRIWRNLSLPKLDLTSFGHWTGTGLVEFKAGE